MVVVVVVDGAGNVRCEKTEWSGFTKRDMDTLTVPVTIGGFGTNPNRDMEAGCMERTDEGESDRQEGMHRQIHRDNSQ